MGNLVPTMIQQPGKKPKLRCKVAECRALIPFVVDLADEFLDKSDPAEDIVLTGMRMLSECYKALSAAQIFSRDTLRECSVKFAEAHCEAAGHYSEAGWFQPKPKLHMFLHMCADGAPAKTWTYRDEDFGGSVAQWAKRRGGLLSAGSFSANILNKFKMRHPVLRIR